MNPELHEPVERERLRRLGQARPHPAVEARIVRGALERIERRPARRWLPAFAAATATAAAAVAFLVTGPSVDGGPAAADLAPGAILAADAEARSFAFAGHEVLVAPGSRVVVERVAGAAADLRVEQGEATFTVDPLRGDDRFRVATASAAVEVVGTVFAVRVEGDCTDVSVTRGKVRAGAPGAEARLLGAGESTRLCPPAAAADMVEALPGEAQVREAIRLLAEGRDLPRASSLLNAYRGQYPDGVFQEEALFHLCRIEAQLGHADVATRLADEFVARFPASARAARIQAWCTPGR